MALPREQDTYDDYTDQLVYFSARLAADPAVACLAAKVDGLLEELDADFDGLRAARRAEVRTRAKRDHQDKLGSNRVKKYRRHLRVVPDPKFAIERIFPKGTAHVVAPRGRARIERLEALIAATGGVLASPRLELNANTEELREILRAGKVAATGALEALRTCIEQWETERLNVVRARDAFNFRRAQGVRRLGVVLGELRARLGGSARAAYAYTQPGRNNRSPTRLEK
jgi:hypothetical protein